MNVFVLLNTKEDILKNVETEQIWGKIDLRGIFTMEINGAQKSLVTNFLQNIFLCVRQKKKKLYRFETSWGWVNDERIFFLAELSL